MAGNFKKKDKSDSALIRNLKNKGMEYLTLTGVEWDLKVPKEDYEDYYQKKVEDAMDDYYERQEEEQLDYQDQIDSGLIYDESEYLNDKDEYGLLYQEPFEVTSELKAKIDAEIRSEYAAKKDLLSTVVLEFKNIGNLDSLKEDKDLLKAKVEEQYAGQIMDFKDVRKSTNEDILFYNTKKTINDLVNGKNFKAYLNLYGNFSAYSAANTALVYWQCPNATMVKGVKSWEALGRHPKTGSQAICINGYPKEPKVINDKDEFDKYITESKYLNDPVNARQKEKLIEEFEQTGEVKIVYNVKTIYVFDVSQTEGKELENLKVKMLDADLSNFETIKTALVDLVKEVQGTEVTFEQNKDMTYMFLSSSNSILVNGSLSEQDQIKYLSEGIADAFLHNGQPKLPGIRSNAPKDKTLQKLESCSVAYLMMQKLGIEADYAFQDMLKPLADNQNQNKLSNSKNKSDPIIQNFSSCLSRAKVCATAMEDKINEKIKELGLEENKDIELEER